MRPSFSLHALFTAFISMLLIHSGITLEINILQHSGLYLLIMSVCTVFLGVQVMRYLACPCIMLMICIPFAGHLDSILQVITLKLTSLLLHISQITYYVEDMFIDTPSGVFEITHECSGVRFLMIMTLISGYFSSRLFFRNQPAKVILWTAAASTLSIVINSLRVYIIILLSSIFETYTFHEYSHITVGVILFSVFQILFLKVAMRVSGENTLLIFHRRENKNIATTLLCPPIQLLANLFSIFTLLILALMFWLFFNYKIIHVNNQNMNKQLNTLENKDSSIKEWLPDGWEIFSYNKEKYMLNDVFFPEAMISTTHVRNYENSVSIINICYPNYSATGGIGYYANTFSKEMWRFTRSYSAYINTLPDTILPNNANIRVFKESAPLFSEKEYVVVSWFRVGNTWLKTDIAAKIYGMLYLLAGRLSTESIIAIASPDADNPEQQLHSIEEFLRVAGDIRQLTICS